MERHDEVTPGTVISVHQHRVGGQHRLAEVLEVIGGTGHRRYRVRWDDGHESIFFPGEDAVMERVTTASGHARRGAPAARRRHPS